MRPNETRDLAIKLFGLYYAARFAVYVPQVFSVFFMSGHDQEFLQSKFVVFLATSLPPLLYVVLAWACLFKTKLVLALLWSSKTESGEAPASGHALSSLSFWITLVGVFYLVSSTAGLLSQLWILGVNRQMFGSTFMSAKFLPNIFLFPLSIFCILKAGRIEEFINKKQITQPEVGQVSSESAQSASPDEPST